MSRAIREAFRATFTVPSSMSASEVFPVAFSSIRTRTSDPFSTFATPTLWEVTDTFPSVEVREVELSTVVVFRVTSTSVTCTVAEAVTPPDVACTSKAPASEPATKVPFGVTVWLVPSLTKLHVAFAVWTMLWCASRPWPVNSTMSPGATVALVGWSLRSLRAPGFTVTSAWVVRAPKVAVTSTVPVLKARSTSSSRMTVSFSVVMEASMPARVSPLDFTPSTLRGRREPAVIVASAGWMRMDSSCPGSSTTSTSTEVLIPVVVLVTVIVAVPSWRASRVPVEGSTSTMSGWELDQVRSASTSLPCTSSGCTTRVCVEPWRSSRLEWSLRITDRTPGVRVTLAESSTDGSEESWAVTA